MKEENKIKLEGSGIKCDNPECDYKDMTVAVDDYPNWVDKPCPKCGENLLTKEDYLAVKQLYAVIELLNAKPDEEIAELTKTTGADELAEELGYGKDERVKVTMNVHNGKLDIKKIQKDDGKDEVSAEG